jgi:hypothetical protein
VLVTPSFQVLDVLRFLVGWLVVAHALRSIFQREYAFTTLLVLAAVTQLACMVVVGKTLNLSELIGLAAMFALLPFVQRLPTARHLLVLGLALAAVIVIQGLEPWRLEIVDRNFSWVPFENSLSGFLEVNIGALLEKCFWYTGLVWLLTQRMGSPIAAALVTALLVALVEFAQIGLPGRSAEITDPLLVLVAAGLVALFGAGPVQEPAEK